MDGMDFIIPLKKVGIFTRAVFESIYLYYNPRRIVVVTISEEIQTLKNLILEYKWILGNLEIIYIEETSFFTTNGLNLTLESILEEYDETIPGNQREPGWWIQQLIKLGAPSQVPNISPVYVVWDADLIPLEKWPLFEPDTGKYFTAILQEFPRSEFNSIEYAKSMKELTGLTAIEPAQNCGTFVTHHMVFHCKYVTELLDLIIKNTGHVDWPKKIMAISRKFFRFSEYKTYATYMMNYHPEEFNYHSFHRYGKNGIRYRDLTEIMQELVDVYDGFFDGGFSFAQIRDYYYNKYNNTLEMPSYVQFEHSYGIDIKK